MFVIIMNKDAWDDMSTKYDESVENNSDIIISNFISEEIRIVVKICKKIISLNSNKKYTIIDMGSGTGRVLFSLCRELKDTASYVGIDSSKPMIELSKKKKSKLDLYDFSFHNYDVTSPEISQFFDDSSVKIIMCMYNTIGVIPAEKRQQFFDTMRDLAGEEGIVLISAFNGDDFEFVAPKIYTPMKNMVHKIDDDSFDVEKLAFKNSLGYYSQWFTKNQISNLLHSDIIPHPINISSNGISRIFGNVFSSRTI